MLVLVFTPQRSWFEDFCRELHLTAAPALTREKRPDSLTIQGIRFQWGGDSVDRLRGLANVHYVIRPYAWQLKNWGEMRTFIRHREVTAGWKPFPSTFFGDLTQKHF